METDIYDNDEDLELLKQLRIKEKNCAACSREWCKFTQEMLQDYADNTFRSFDIKPEMTIQSYITSQRRIEIKL